ncbi:3D domain-containing protein [Alicyclobacillus fodiniaquatilis]|jgi:3D (Asp-Asp-Asp) domain-containing protein
MNKRLSILQSERWASTMLCAIIMWFATCAHASAQQSAELPRDNEAVSAFGKVFDLRDYTAKEGTFTLTAYNLDKISTGKDPGDPGYGVTATGTSAASGRTVAVDPTVIPYGALLRIDGVGWRVAEDTGGAIRGNHIDVLVESRRGALTFGVKRHCHVEIYLPKTPEDAAPVHQIANRRFGA